MGRVKYAQQVELEVRSRGSARQPRKLGREARADVRSYLAAIIVPEHRSAQSRLSITPSRVATKPCVQSAYYHALNAIFCSAPGRHRHGASATFNRRLHVHLSPIR